MANIPTYEGGVQSKGLPTPFLSLDTHGAFDGVGEGLQRLGAGIGKASGEVQQAREEADAALIAQAESRLGDSINTKLFDANQGFLAKRGENAVRDSRQTADDLEAQRRDIGKLLNPRARQIFDQRSATSLQQARRQIENHTAQQIDAVKDDADKARDRTALSTIANNFSDPQARDREIQNQRVWLELRAQRLGASPETKQALIDDFDRRAAQTVLEQYLARSDGTGAQIYLGSVMPNGRPVREVLGAAAPKYIHDVQEVAKGQEAEREALKIATAARDPATGWIDHSAALSEVDKVPEGPLKDELRQRVEHRLGADRAARVADDSPREARLEVGMYKGRGLSRTSYDYLKLSDEGKARVESKWNSFRRSARAEGSAERRLQQETDQYLKHYYLGSLSTGEQASIDIDHAQVFAEGSPTLRESLKAKQKQVRKVVEGGGAVKLGEFNGFVNKQARELGLNKDVTADLTSYMTDWHLRWLEEHDGQEPTRKDMKDAVGEALLVGDEKGGSLLSRNQRKFQAAQQGRKFVPFKPEEQETEAAKETARRLLGQPQAATQPGAAPATPTPGAQVPSEQLGFPPGGIFELQPNGKYKRVK